MTFPGHAKVSLFVPHWLKALDVLEHRVRELDAFIGNGTPIEIAFARQERSLLNDICVDIRAQIEKGPEDEPQA